MSGKADLKLKKEESQSYPASQHQDQEEKGSLDSHCNIVGFM